MGKDGCCSSSENRGPICNLFAKTFGKLFGAFKCCGKGECKTEACETGEAKKAGDCGSEKGGGSCGC